MKIQDQIIAETKKAAEEVFRYATAVPDDKAEWKPLDHGRSVLDIVRELAKCPVWAHDLVAGLDLPPHTEEAMVEQRAEMQSWKTIAECKHVCFENLDKMFEVYAAVSDERLVETKWLPFDGGRDFTVQEMMDYPRWNFTWHAGQIAYVQTLYGDSGMY